MWHQTQLVGVTSSVSYYKQSDSVTMDMTPSHPVSPPGLPERWHPGLCPLNRRLEETSVLRVTNSGGKAWRYWHIGFPTIGTAQHSTVKFTVKKLYSFRQPEMKGIWGKPLWDKSENKQIKTAWKKTQKLCEEKKTSQNYHWSPCKIRHCINETKTESCLKN